MLYTNAPFISACWTVSVYNAKQAMHHASISTLVDWLTGLLKGVRGQTIRHMTRAWPGYRPPLSRRSGTRGDAGYALVQPDLPLHVPRRGHGEWLDLNRWTSLGPRSNTEAPIGSTTPRRGHWLGWLVMVEARRPLMNDRKISVHGTIHLHRWSGGWVGII